MVRAWRQRRWRTSGWPREGLLPGLARDQAPFVEEGLETVVAQATRQGFYVRLVGAGVAEEDIVGRHRPSGGLILLGGPFDLPDSPSEPVALQGFEQVVEGMRWILQDRSLPPDHIYDDVESPIEQLEDELVGCSHLDSMTTEHDGWEVPDILGNDPPE